MSCVQIRVMLWPNLCYFLCLNFGNCLNFALFYQFALFYRFNNLTLMCENIQISPPEVVFQRELRVLSRNKSLITLSLYIYYIYIYISVQYYAIKFSHKNNPDTKFFFWGSGMWFLGIYTVKNSWGKWILAGFVVMRWLWAITLIPKWINFPQNSCSPRRW